MRFFIAWGAGMSPYKQGDFRLGTYPIRLYFYVCFYPAITPRALLLFFYVHSGGTGAGLPKTKKRVIE